MMGDYNDDDIVFVGVVKTEPRDSGYWDKEYVCDEDFSIEEEDNEPWPYNPFMDEYREEVNKTRKHKLLGVNNRMSMLINQICALVEEGVDPSLYEEYSLDEIGEGKAVHGWSDSNASCRNRKDDVSKSSRKNENKNVHEKQKDVISYTQQYETVHQLGDQLGELGEKQCIQEYETCETTMEQTLERALPCSRDVTENFAQKDLSPDAVGRAENYKALQEFMKMRKQPVVELVRVSLPFIQSMTSISTKNLQSVEDSSIKFQDGTKHGANVSGTAEELKIKNKDVELMEAEKRAEEQKIKSASCSTLQTKTERKTGRTCDRANRLWTAKHPVVLVPSDRELRRSKTSKLLIGEELSTKLQIETSAERIQQPRNNRKLKEVRLENKRLGKSTCDQSTDQRELVPEKTLLQASLEVCTSFKTSSSLQTSLAASLSTFKGTMHQRKSYRTPKCSVEKTLSETVNARVRVSQSRKSSIREHVPYSEEMFTTAKHVTSEHDPSAESNWKLKRKINWGSDNSTPREKRTHSTTLEFAVQETAEASLEKSLLTGGKKKSKIKW